MYHNVATFKGLTKLEPLSRGNGASVSRSSEIHEAPSFQACSLPAGHAIPHAFTAQPAGILFGGNIGDGDC